MMSPGNGDEAVAVYVSFVSGYLAGLISALVTQPIDTVKTNMQSLTAERYRRSVLGCCRELMSSGGLSAFYRGIGPRLVRVPLEQALLFTFYHAIGRFLDDWRLTGNCGS
mmetsp:Transcript_20233/g.49637  ORF Transcript_20233/g.49637 Transcript_20233/m.49637 type:complete len:110 (-) Transcript_20233:94-423(-)